MTDPVHVTSSATASDDLIFSADVLKSTEFYLCPPTHPGIPAISILGVSTLRGRDSGINTSHRPPSSAESPGKLQKLLAFTNLSS